MKVKEAIERLKKMDPEKPFVFTIIDTSLPLDDDNRCIALNVDDIHEIEFEDGEVVVTGVTDDEIEEDDAPLTSFICLN